MTEKNTSIFYLGLLCAFPLLSFDIFQPALPAITAYFQTSHAAGQLTLSLFFFVFGLSQLIWGPLIDHYGRIKMLNISCYLFFAATVLCLFASNIEVLILARALQGFAVCCANVLVFSSLRDIEDTTARAKILSYVSMIVSVSPIFAPLLGSLIFESFGWRAIFFFMGIVVVVVYLVSPKRLHESPYRQQTSEKWSFHTTLKNYKEILGHKDLWVAIIILTASYSCVLILLVNGAYLLIDNLGASPLLFSVLFALNGLMIIASNFLGIKLRNRRSLEWNIRRGCIVMTAASLLTLVCFYFLGLSYISLAPVLLVCSGVILTNTPAFSLVLNDYTHQAATATAIINTVRTCLASLVAGIVGSIIVYHIFILPLSLLLCSVICLLMSRVYYTSLPLQGDPSKKV